MRSSRAGGFTLVELLVVIGIIAVLISILLPVMNRAREQARSVACLSNLRQFQMGSFNYANDNRGFFAPIILKTTDLNTDFATSLTLRKYLGLFPQPASLPDPPAYDSMINSSQICANAYYARYALGNGVGPTFTMRYTYGMNYSEFADPAYPSLWASGPTPPPNVQYRATRVKNSAKKIAWADALSFKIRAAASSKFIAEAPSSYVAGFPQLPSNDMISYRHFGGANVVFFDGHGEWMPRKAVDITYLSPRQVNDLWYPYYGVIQNTK